jgi:SAM-dependent methyltransferase
MAQAEFDRFAHSYDDDLAKSLAVTGEDRNFYAQGRIDWTAECLARLRFQPRRILDYGCGDGMNAPLLAAKFQADRVLGVDVSSASIAVARQSNHEPTGRPIWPSRTESSITSRRPNAASACSPFAALCGREHCLLFGKTIRGIRVRAM